MGKDLFARIGARPVPFVAPSARLAVRRFSLIRSEGSVVAVSMPRKKADSNVPAARPPIAPAAMPRAVAFNGCPIAPGRASGVWGRRPSRPRLVPKAEAASSDRPMRAAGSWMGQRLCLARNSADIA